MCKVRYIYKTDQTYLTHIKIKERTKQTKRKVSRLLDPFHHSIFKEKPNLCGEKEYFSQHH